MWKAKDVSDRNGQLRHHPETDRLQQLPSQAPKQIWQQRCSYFIQHFKFFNIKLPRSCSFIEKNLSCRKWSGRGGNKGPKGPTCVVGDPVLLRLHDDLSLPHGAQQVRAEVRSGEKWMSLCFRSGATSPSQPRRYGLEEICRIWCCGMDIDICELQLFWQRVDLFAQLGEQK